MTMAQTPTNDKNHDVQMYSYCGALREMMMRPFFVLFKALIGLPRKQAICC